MNRAIVGAAVGLPSEAVRRPDRRDSGLRMGWGLS
jgi:hypothetical protein